METNTNTSDAPTNGKVVLAVMNDLFFGLKIQEAAKVLCAKVLFQKDLGSLLERLAEEPAAVIFDLNYAGIDSVGIIRQLKTNEGTRKIPLIGFISHVQVELKQEAVNAGCDVVVARSAFSRDLPVILRHYL